MWFLVLLIANFIKLFFILDILLICIIVVVVFMVYSGLISLLDRKIMAMTQNRVGPGLFLFGICTPIFDGVKLILKFGLLILNVDLFYLFFIIVSSLIFNYFIFFVIPLSNIVLVNLNHNHFIILATHTMLNVINTFLVGCHIINTCFVYLATIRSILFTIIGEFCILIVFLIILNFSFQTQFTFTLVNVENLYLWNMFLIPLFIFFLTIIAFYVQNMINIFEFSEAESELVAGTITEFSGIFFCISSLFEIAHVIISVYLLVTIFVGGFFLGWKLLLFLIALFLVPKLLLCRLKINNALLFLFFYVLNYLFIYFLLVSCIKLTCISIM